MEELIAPVATELLLAELTPKRKFQNTNKGGNELYIFDAHEAPNLMREVARLREEAFRSEGGCTGKSMDMDEFDTMEVPYKQLIVWDPDAKAIIGGYRFILGPDIRLDDNGQPILATAHQFRFSELFINEYLPHVIELGRSFVSTGYQSSKAGSKSLFALDNLWDGITGVIMQHPDIMYLFGKVTVHPGYNEIARNLITYFMRKHFGAKTELVTPIEPVPDTIPAELISLIFTGEDYKTDYAILKDSLHKLGSFIPPLINSYMNVSPTMQYFGFSPCPDLKGAIEGGILICFEDLYDSKKGRHVKAFLDNTIRNLKARFPHIPEDKIAENLMIRWTERRLRSMARFQDKLNQKK